MKRIHIEKASFDKLAYRVNVAVKERDYWLSRLDSLGIFERVTEWGVENTLLHHDVEFLCFLSPRVEPVDIEKFLALGTTE